MIHQLTTFIYHLCRYTAIVAVIITLAFLLASERVSASPSSGISMSTGQLETRVSAPTITSFTPTYGTKYTRVTIRGTNLQGAVSVRFGRDMTARRIISSSATSVVAMVGNGTTGRVTVITPEGTAISSASFTVIPDTSNLSLLISPATQTVSPGESFDVKVLVNTDSVISRGANLGFVFDSTKLQCRSISEGSFYSSWAQSHDCQTLIYPDPGITNKAGQVSLFGIAIIGQTAGGPSGSGELCTIHLAARQGASGQAGLNITGAQIAENSGQSTIMLNNVTITNGLITISSASPAASSAAPLPAVSSVKSQTPVAPSKTPVPSGNIAQATPVQNTAELPPVAASAVPAGNGLLSSSTGNSVSEDHLSNTDRSISWTTLGVVAAAEVLVMIGIIYFLMRILRRKPRGGEKK